MKVKKTSRVATVKYDKKTKEHYLDINDFKDVVDISKVTYYELETEEGSVFVKFYDKNKKLIKL